MGYFKYEKESIVVTSSEKSDTPFMMCICHANGFSAQYETAGSCGVIIVRSGGSVAKEVFMGNDSEKMKAHAMREITSLTRAVYTGEGRYEFNSYVEEKE